MYTEVMENGLHYVQVALNEVPLYIRENCCIFRWRMRWRWWMLWICSIGPLLVLTKRPLLYMMMTVLGWHMKIRVIIQQ